MTHSLQRNLSVCFSLLGLSGTLATPAAWAQAPTVVAVRPVRHASAAVRTANVRVKFSQPLSAASAVAPAGLRVFGNQLRGRRPAVLLGAGTDSLVADPVQDFAPGERVSVSISAALQNAAGMPVAGQVGQFWAAAGGSGRGVFSLGSSPTYSSNAAATTLADTDNDGDLDLVTLTINASGSRSIGIRLNNGSGVFPTLASATLNSTTLNIVLGDLDADGDLDLVGVDNQYVGYQLNNGTGYFSQLTNLVVGSGPSSGSRGLELGDLDADGDLDIVTTDLNDNTATLLLNNGAGTFAAGVAVPVGARPVGLALGDFDNDGDLDLATTHQPATYGLPGAVRVAVNNGSAGFTAGQPLAVGAGPDYLTAADFDNDGRLDLAVANTSNFTVTLLRNTGALAFAASQPLLLGNLPVALRAADVDADGDLDLLAATNRPGLAAVKLALNFGNGTFGPMAPLPGLPAPTTLAVGDLDGDGDLDLAVGSAGNTGIALNQPAPAPAISGLTPAQGIPSTRVVVRGSNLLTASRCAFNGVPALNFTVNSATQLTVEVPAGATSGPVTVTTTAGTAASGRFRVTGPVLLTGSSPAAQVLTAPVNGAVSLTFDHPITAASAGNVAVYGSRRQGRRAGTATVVGNTVQFQPAVPFAPGEHVTVSVPTSLDSDTTGNTTRRVIQFDAATGGTGRSAVFLPVAPVPITQSGGGMVAGDLDGDGDVDLIATYSAYTGVTWQGYAAVRFNNGSASYSGTQSFSLPVQPLGTRDLRLGDVDGDGDLDLVVSASTIYNISNVQTAVVTIYRNNGQGVFTVPSGPAVTMYDCTALALGDLDADGDLDLMALDPTSGRVEVRFNDGTANFDQAGGALVCEQTGSLGGSWLFLADFDKDGDLDALTAGAGGGASAFLNDGQGRFGAAVNSALWGYDPVRYAVMGDINGDGFPDVISNPGGPSRTGLAFHLGDGTGHFAPADATNSISLYENFNFALGDFDADGDLDMVTGGNSTADALTMWVNDGTGHFAYDYYNRLRGNERGDLALADLDGDGDLDILSSGSGNSNGVLVALNQPYRPPLVAGLTPDNGFVGTSVRIAGSYLGNTTQVRFNGTVASFTIDSPSQLTATVPAGATTGPVTVENSVGTGTSPGSFTVLQPAYITSYSPQPRAVAVPATAPIVLGLSRPLPATPAPWLVLTTSQSASLAYQVGGAGSSTATLTHARAFRPGEKVSVLLPGYFPVATPYQYRPQLFDFTVAAGGSGRGNFTGTTTLPAAAPQPVATRVADFNNDGLLDAVTVGAGNNSLRVYLGGSQGLTAQTPIPNYPDLQDLAVVDLDRDGDLDLAGLSTIGNGLSGTGVLTTYYNPGTGGFSGPSYSTLNVGLTPTALVPGDVNLDGYSDVLVANAGSSTLTLLLGDYYGLSGQLRVTYPLPAAPHGIALADVDGDGDLDALVTYPSLNAVGLLRNNGSGTFVVEAATVAVGSSPHALAAEDLDGDGDVDLAVVNTAAGTVSVRWGNNQGSFAPGPDLAVGATPGPLTLADVDADGDLDVLTTIPAAGTVALLRNTGGSFAAAAAVAVGGTPATLALGDLDNDGDLDLLTADRVAGTVALRLNSTSLSATAEPTWAGAVTVFPNPARTEATLRLPPLPAAHLTVCNVLGQRVLDRQVAANTTSVVLDVHALAPGLYLLQLDTGNGGQLTRRLLVE